MKKFKTILAVCIIAVIIAVCAIAASADLSCSTEVYWNPNETEAWAETVGYGPSYAQFYVHAMIHSNSTYQHRVAYANSNYTTFVTAKLMILTDTFFDFLLLTVGAFVTGNALVILLKETVFKEVQLFSIYMLDPQVIVFSLSAVILLTVFLSVIAIAKTFTAGNTNEYRA